MVTNVIHCHKNPNNKCRIILLLLLRENNEPLLVPLHTNGVIMRTNYHMALVKEEPSSSPRGRNAKQKQTVVSAESREGGEFLFYYTGVKRTENTPAATDMQTNIQCTHRRLDPNSESTLH